MVDSIDWATEFLNDLIPLKHEPGVLIHEVEIAERMLEEQAMMPKVFLDLSRQVPFRNHRRLVLHNLVCTLATHRPENIDAAKVAERQAAELTDELGVLYQRIRQSYQRVRQCCEERDQLANTYGLGTPDDYHPGEWIVHAIDYIDDPQTKHLFGARLLKPLQRLLAEFDFNYWPTPEAIFTMLAERQERQTVGQAHPTMLAAAQGRTTDNGLLRALWECQFKLIDTFHMPEAGAVAAIPIPLFRLRDFSMAALASMVSSGPSGYGFDPESIRKARLRIRNSLAAKSDLLPCDDASEAELEFYSHRVR